MMRGRVNKEAVEALKCLWTLKTAVTTAGSDFNIGSAIRKYFILTESMHSERISQKKGHTSVQYSAIPLS